MSSLNDLITRKYSNFKGVDFSDNNVNLYRSPNALNMWKKYEESECIQTRPGMKLLENFGNNILGLFFFEKDDNGTNSDLDIVYGLCFDKSTFKSKHKMIWRPKNWGYIELPEPEVINRS